jgi:CDP-paratose 2-epimerase
MTRASETAGNAPLPRVLDARAPDAGTLRPVLITGGAGFIGTNLAHRLLCGGRRVLLLDNLSRRGVEQNAQWLLGRHDPHVRLQVADIRDAAAVRHAVARASHIFHFAAQVAVTTSLAEPLEDFQINVQGTLNVLEAMRAQPQPPPLVFTSTNKVYGALDEVIAGAAGSRYDPADLTFRTHGLDERRSLDFHSPYGCSKGAADQYVLDYARSYDLPAVVFRMSCTYGPHQFGTEDQGWVAHFLISAIDEQPITLYGDGLQVRDVLFVDDLVDALLLAQHHMPALAGRAFNIGGGPEHAISLLELLDLIAEVHGARPPVRFDAWRPGDQRFYVSDVRRFGSATGWRPQTTVRTGLMRLRDWLVESRGLPPPVALRASGVA